MDGSGACTHTCSAKPGGAGPGASTSTTRPLSPESAAAGLAQSTAALPPGVSSVNPAGGPLPSPGSNESAKSSPLAAAECTVASPSIRITSCPLRLAGCGEMQPFRLATVPPPALPFAMVLDCRHRLRVLFLLCTVFAGGRGAGETGSE